MESSLAVGSLLHISVQVTCDFPGICAQLLEQLVGIHEVDKALEALALLVDLLVLTPMQKFFLHAVKQLILVRHEIVGLVLRVGVLIVILIIFTFLLNEEPVDELDKSALVVLLILFGLLIDHTIQALL